MKILIPVAAFCEYNTAIYIESALKRLGHEAQIINQGEFYGDLDADLFFAVDSGGPLDFPDKHLAKCAMWFIDSRHNNNPARRNPDDDTNARKINSGGGWVFQAQRPDWLRNAQTGTVRSTWLPLAADPDVWRPIKEAKKHYDVGFAGNIWDPWRSRMLEQIRAQFSLGLWQGLPEELAVRYSDSRVGFNCSSFMTSPLAYDVNMRVFEILSCGLPLITNAITELADLGILNRITCLTYTDEHGALSAIREALAWPQEQRDAMGVRARVLIVKEHTYRHRMEHALEVLREAGVIE